MQVARPASFVDAALFPAKLQRGLELGMEIDVRRIQIQVGVFVLVLHCFVWYNSIVCTLMLFFACVLL